MKLFVVTLIVQHEDGLSVLQLKSIGTCKEDAVREAKLYAVFDKPVLFFTNAIALEVTQNDIAWAEQYN